MFLQRRQSELLFQIKQKESTGVLQNQTWMSCSLVFTRGSYGGSLFLSWTGDNINFSLSCTNVTNTGDSDSSKLTKEFPRKNEGLIIYEGGPIST